ncbi:MAG TPA: lysine-2,3-aminomutase-like protein [Alphaproteobacteria bacterium]|nr:lysine-2,3-aminomutase-like protein [Alphaproteobacteria bacterium]
MTSFPMATPSDRRTPTANDTRESALSQAGSLRQVPALVKAGLVAADEAPAIEKVAARYAVAITPTVAGLIDRHDPADPIARQFVPSADEFETLPYERTDPIGDEAHSPVKGIVHRYPDRVLLKPLHACPVYCRFCFRREQVGPGGAALNEAELAAAIDYIRARPQIWEVILTGGDPLMLAPRRLAGIIAALSEIPHVATLRIHSRVPVADPARIDAALLEALGSPLPVWLAIHANHPRELGPEAAAACARLARAGVSLLGQTVLLRGVNADVGVLEALFRAMVRARIKPYYLHHPDLAPGTSGFRVSIVEGRALMRSLRGRLSGIAQPTYVLDIPGGEGKVPIGPDFVEDAGIRDSQGRLWPHPEIGDLWGTVGQE